MSDTFAATCPHCSAVNRVPAAYYQKEVSCNACAKRFDAIPSQAPAPAGQPLTHTDELSRAVKWVVRVVVLLSLPLIAWKCAEILAR